MSEAIAFPIAILPAASAAVQATDAAASGEGFAAALAQLLGLGTPATPTVVTPAQGQTQSGKPQTPKIAPAPTSEAQPDIALAAAAQVTIAPVTPALVRPLATETNAAPIATNAIAPQKPTKASVPASAPDFVAAAALETLSTATDTQSATPAAPAAQPQATPAAPALAMAAALVQAHTPETANVPSASLKTAPKAAPAKHAAGAPTLEPQANTGEAQTQATGKPATTPIAPIAQQSTEHGAGNNGHQFAGAKPETSVASLSATATPVVLTVHNHIETPAATAATAQAAPVAVPVDALAVHIARKFESGESRFEIRLDPIELGKLDISMTVSDDGRVQAVVRAERPETLDLLQRDARLLEGQLRQSGLNVDSGSLNFSLGHGNGNRNAFGDHASPFARALGLGPDIEQQTPTTAAIVSVRDGIDIRI